MLKRKMYRMVQYFNERWSIPISPRRSIINPCTVPEISLAALKKIDVCNQHH